MSRITFAPTLGILLSLSAQLVYPAHEIAISAAQMAQIGITLAPVEGTNIVMTDRLPARVTIPPNQERVVSAPDAGLVSNLLAAVGEEVAADQVIAILESVDFIGLQREFLQAVTELRLARADLRRDQQLNQEGIIAARRFLETRGRFEQARARLDERRQALLLVGMDAVAIQRLENTRQLSSTLEVKAPIAGAVLENMTTLGQRVARADPLYRLAQLEPLWLELRIPLDRLPGVTSGTAVALPCADAKAQVMAIGPSVDPINQTVLVRAEVKGARGCLRPGQFIEGRLQLGAAKQQFRIPSSALARGSKVTMVFVHAPFGFLATPVTVLSEQDGYAVVDGGLQVGQSVAASGIAAIKAAWTGLGGSE